MFAGQYYIFAYKQNSISSQFYSPPLYMPSVFC